MNGTDLLKSIGDIDDDLIHEAYINTADSTPAQWSTKKPWLKWGSMAACLLCIGAVSISAYRMHQSSQNTSESAVATYGIESYNTPVEAFSQESDVSMSEAPAAYLMDESADIRLSPNILVIWMPYIVMVLRQKEAISCITTLKKHYHRIKMSHMHIKCVLIYLPMKMILLKVLITSMAIQKPIRIFLHKNVSVCKVLIWMLPYQQIIK